MVPEYKTTPDIFAFWCVAALVFLMLGRYGKQAVEWLLMKLYEFFIQNNPVRW